MTFALLSVTSLYNPNYGGYWIAGVLALSFGVSVIVDIVCLKIEQAPAVSTPETAQASI